jgi:membrane protease YdiL (CAAX protease family)
VVAVGAFYALYVAVAVAVDGVHGLIVPAGGWWRTAGRGLLGLSVPPLVAAALVYGGIVRLVRRPPATWGARPAPEALRGAARGLVWGIGLAAMTVGLCLAGGARLLVRPAPEESYWAVVAPLVVGLALAALLEELLFRGFPLARLAEGVGPAVGSVMLTVGFVAAHAGNPAVSGVGLVNIGLASLLLCAAFFAPGGLATAVGLHLGWNAALVLGADAPVSGLRFGLPALEFAPGPWAWWTGGAFGPEGGVAATLVLGGALAWWARRGAPGWRQWGTQEGT